MKWQRWTIALIVVLTAACDGTGPTPTTADQPAQAPPPTAEPVEILSVELTAGSFGERLVVEGTQPSPCHGLGWFTAPSAGRVEVTMWSEPPPAGEVCAQVIEPFTVEIDLGSTESGTEVVLNGEVVGAVG